MIERAHQNESAGTKQHVVKYWKSKNMGAGIKLSPPLYVQQGPFKFLQQKKISLLGKIYGPKRVILTAELV